MPAGPRPRHQPTDDWDQLRLLVTSPEQETYELLRPVVLFGQSARARAQETGVPERSLRRKVARFAAAGMRSLFEQEPEPARDRRRLPAAIRRAIVELKAEYPPFSLREIATICRDRFDRPVDHHTVKRVLATEPLPLRPPRRFRRYHEIADPVQRRKAIVELYLEGWSALDCRHRRDLELLLYLLPQATARSRRSRHCRRATRELAVNNLDAKLAREVLKLARRDDDAAQIVPLQVPAGQIGAAQIGLEERRLLDVGVGEVAVDEGGSRQVRQAEVRLDEGAPFEAQLLQRDAPKGSVFERAFLKRRRGERDAFPKIEAHQLALCEPGREEVAPGNLRAAQVARPQHRGIEPSSRQVCSHKGTPIKQTGLELHMRHRQAGEVAIAVLLVTHDLFKRYDLTHVDPPCPSNQRLTADS